jgi:hypothetical protein
MSKRKAVWAYRIGTFWKAPACDCGTISSSLQTNNKVKTTQKSNRTKHGYADVKRLAGAVRERERERERERMISQL